MAAAAERFEYPAQSGAVPSGASRIAGRGRLLRSLRALSRRVERFAVHRARTDAERAWAVRVADDLDALLAVALDAPGSRAALAAVDRRAAVSRKGRAS